MTIGNREPIKTIRCCVDGWKVELDLFTYLSIISGDSAVGKTWVFKKLYERSKRDHYLRKRNPISLEYFDAQASIEDIMSSRYDIVVVDEAHNFGFGASELLKIILAEQCSDMTPEKLFVLIGRGIGVSGLGLGALELSQTEDKFRFRYTLANEEDVKYD